MKLPEVLIVWWCPDCEMHWLTPRHGMCPRCYRHERERKVYVLT